MDRVRDVRGWTLTVLGVALLAAVPATGTGTQIVVEAPAWGRIGATTPFNAVISTDPGALGLSQQKLEAWRDDVRLGQGNTDFNGRTRFTATGIAPGPNALRVETLDKGILFARADASVFGVPAPAPVAGLTAEVIGYDLVRLSWTPPVDEHGFYAYRVMRQLSAGFVQVGETTAGTFDDTTLGGLTYAYRVDTVDPAGATPGPTLVVTTPPRPPPDTLTAYMSAVEICDPICRPVDRYGTVTVVAGRSMTVKITTDGHVTGADRPLRNERVNEDLYGFFPEPCPDYCPGCGYKTCDGCYGYSCGCGYSCSGGGYCYGYSCSDGTSIHQATSTMTQVDGSWAWTFSVTWPQGVPTGWCLAPHFDMDTKVAGTALRVTDYMSFVACAG